MLFGPAPENQQATLKGHISNAVAKLRVHVPSSADRATNSMPIMSPSPRTSPTYRKRRGQSASGPACTRPLAAFSIRLSSSSSMVVRAAAIDTGLPPNVEACAPGGQFITSARANVADQRHPARNAFSQRHNVGTRRQNAPKRTSCRSVPCRTALHRESAECRICRRSAAVPDGTWLGRTR